MAFAGKTEVIWFQLSTNRPYLESAFFLNVYDFDIYSCVIRKKIISLKNPENVNKISHLV